MLLTTFTVSVVGDPANPTTGDGSLREAILASNADTTSLPNQIVFDLPVSSEIFPLTPLPTITEPVVIDGSTATNYDPTNPSAAIQIDGSKESTGTVAGLVLMSPGISLKQLDITDFSGDGIDVNGGSDSISGTFVGVDTTGSKKEPNAGNGITIASANNVIGDPTTNANVISGNNKGIQITGAASTGNLVTHSYIGTDFSGTLKIGNTFSGIEIDSGKNTIGGVASNGPLSAGNLISDNNTGISITSTGANFNMIEGNYIGTDVTGKVADDTSGKGTLGNVFDGIDLQGVTNTLIGGTVAGAGNVISNNGFNGIEITGGTTTANAIEGNYIGVASDGVSALGNGENGVFIFGANNNYVGYTSFTGGFTPQFGNVIANNGKVFSSSNGVLIDAGTGDAVLSNSIYNNASIGINLDQANAGITAPTLTTVESGGAETRITGSLTGQFIQPSTMYRIQFFSSPSPNSVNAGDGKNYLGDLDVTTNNQGVANFTTTLTEGVPVGYIVTSTATQHPFVTNNTSEFGPDTTVTQAAVADLMVTASPPSVPVEPGPFLDQPYTFSYVVTNNGPNDATGVIFTDPIPTGSTFVSSSAGTFAGGVLTDDIGDLASKASVTITVTVTPTATTSTFTNTVSVTSDSLDTNLENNTYTSTTTVSDDADLVDTLTPPSSPSPVGSPITYTLNIGNNGPSSATQVLTTIDFPTSYTSFIVTTDQGTYTVNSDNSVTINTGILPAQSSSTITITVTPTVTGTFDVSATTDSPVADPDTSNNTSSASIVVANAADLGIQTTANPDPVLIGQELAYSLLITNNGPSDATDPVVVDQLPAGVTYVPGDSSAGDGSSLVYDSVANTVTANLSTILAGATQTITIAVIPTASGQIINTSTVSDANEIDPDTTNNVATTVTQVSPADIGVVVNNPVDPLFIGQNAVYQIVVSNQGPAAATNVLLSDILGAGGTIVSTSAGNVVGNTITANLGTIQAGGSVIVTIVVDPTVSGTLIDSASVTSDEIDPDPNDNTSSSSNQVSPVDLAVGVTSSATTSLIDNQLTYVVTVTNNGPATATNVLVTSTLPAGSVLDSVLASQGGVAFTSATTLLGNLGSLASGATATITFVVTPTAVETATLTASVTSDEVDTDTSNNSGSASTTVINLPGVIFFPTPIVAVAENAGSITLTLQRATGSLGAVTVDYATSNYTAVAGVNYVASSGTVTFADGQTTATITIPVLDDDIIDGNSIFLVNLTNPTNGASLGQSEAAVTVVNTDRDTTPPTVSNLSVMTSNNKIVGFVITFDEAMNPVLASLITNYQIFLTNGANASSAVGLAGATYDASTNSVTIVPTAPLPYNHFYRVVANGSTANALTDLAGNVLSGSNGPDTNYDVTYGQGTSLRYTDSHNNSVTINLTGGGTLAIFRANNGDAETINLLGIVPHHSKLTGSVKKLGKTSTGHTNIGTITGFGKFGYVKSSLTTPGFYVGSEVVTTGNSTVSTPVTTLSVASVPVPSTATVTTYSFTDFAPTVLTAKKKTIGGPLGLTN